MADSSQLLVGCCEGGYLVRVVGHGTMQESLAFREFIEQCFEQHGGRVTVDVSRCDYLDSTFLGCLIGIEKKCEHDPSRFVIAADDAARVRLFATSVLDKFLQFTHDCPPAETEMLSLDTPQLEPEELGRHVMQAHRQLAGLNCRDADKFRSIANRLQDELGESAMKWKR